MNEHPCQWCANPARVEGHVTLDADTGELEFCSNECLEDYEERENDRRIERAYERSCQ